MKKKCYKYMLLSFAFLLCVSSHAIDKQQFKRELKKNVKIDSNAELELNTEFSSVEIENWDKNEIDVIIEVEIEARNDDEADKIFRKLKLEINGGGDSVELIANYGDSKAGKNGDHNSEEGWAINIYIKAPKSISLDADMSFGDLVLDEITGKSKFEISFGSLNANKLSHAGNDIFVEFGDGNISNLGAEDINVSFGGLTIENLTSNAKIKSSYGNVEIEKVDRGIDDLELNCSFGNIEITLSSQCSFNIEAFSSFGEVHLDRKIETLKMENEMFSEEVEARIGSGAGRLKIENSYGEVTVDVE